MIQECVFSISASWVAAIASMATAIAAIGTLFWSARTQNKIQKNEVKRSTMDDFNRLQSEVLDKLVQVNRENAEVIAEEREDNEECKQAYNDYRALVARLEHFAVGIEQGAYDLDMVDKLAGEHLIRLLPKIKPIIDAANEYEETDKHYQSFVDLVGLLKERHRRD